MSENDQITARRLVSARLGEPHTCTSTSAMEQFLKGRRLTIIPWICAIAAMRVFLFSAAFPFFNNVDEPAHVDVVCKYAQGHIPSNLEHFGSESCQSMLLYGSPEFLHKPNDFPGNDYPAPLWFVLNKQKLSNISRLTNGLQRMINYESTQQPLYYYLAGRWHELGVFFGIGGGQLVYWLRFMNVMIYALLVIAAYGFVRRLYPGNVFLQFGVPLMLAVFPQDVFYSVNNDVPSALIFTLALYGLLEIYLSKTITYAFAACTGLLVAATMLTKFSNVAIMAALAVVVILKALKLRSADKSPCKTSEQPLPAASKLAVLLFAAALPVALWMARDYFLMHDMTGSVLKTTMLGWKPKPLAQMWHHPIFTLSGSGFFLSDLARTLWRGEFYWRGARLGSAGSDMFYVVTTGTFLAAGIIDMFTRRQNNTAAERIADRTGLLVIAASVGFLVLMSIAFDFGDCCYPSRAHPYMTSGRLMLGALVPFLILYLRGLDFILSKLRLSRFRYAAMLILVVVIGVVDTALSLCVFGSKYNWFHLI